MDAVDMGYGTDKGCLQDVSALGPSPAGLGLGLGTQGHTGGPGEPRAALAMCMSSRICSALPCLPGWPYE